ncbi:MAG: hypothetical protein RL757_1845 [Bacteroidota bacterium]|jgi:hypothetical protein
MKNLFLAVFFGFSSLFSLSSLVAQSTSAQSNSVFLTDEVNITFYATSDTSTVNAARGLALMKMDYDRNLLDSFFYFQKNYRSVEKLLNDATLWDENTFVSNKLIVNCAKEYYLRTFYYEAFSLEIEKQKRNGATQTAARLQIYRDTYFANKLGTKSVFTDLPAVWHTAKTANVSALGEEMAAQEKALRKKGVDLNQISDSLMQFSPENTYNKIKDAPLEYATNKNTIPLAAFSEQSLIWGVSSFVAARFKIELQITFFDKMQQRMAETDAHLLFPETSRLLNIDVLSEKISSVRHTANISTSFQVAMETDLRQLHENTLTLLQSEKFLNKLTNNRPELRAKVRYLQGSLSLLQLLRRGTPADEAIEQTAQNYNNINESEFDAHINFLYLLLKNIETTNKNVTSFLTENDFKKLGKEPYSARFFVALVYHQNEELFAKLDLGSATLRTRGEAVLMPLTSLVRTIHKGDELLTKLNDTEDEQLETYMLYLSSLVESIEQTIRIAENVKNKEANPEFLRWIGIYKSIGGTAKAVREKNYAIVLNNTLGILDQLNNIADESVKKDIQNLIASVSFYGAFGCDLLKSKNDKEIENVLNNYALPVGSYRHKRLWGQNIHINAYAGGFVGGERLRLPNYSYDSTATIFGFSAPIGIDYSWINGGGSANSVFLSIVDLGAVVSYRVGGGPVYAQPALKLENILSPGISYFRHFKKNPISIGATLQMSPRLRQLTVDNSVVNSNFALRGGLSVVVDIPIFRIASF